MNPLRAFWKIHSGLRKAQAVYRIRHGKAPATLPWEQGDPMLDKLKGLFVGKNSQKSPLAAGLSAAYFLMSLLGHPIPGLPVVSEDAAVTGFSLAVTALFLSFRVKKSGPVNPTP